MDSTSRPASRHPLTGVVDDRSRHDLERELRFGWEDATPFSDACHLDDPLGHPRCAEDVFLAVGGTEPRRRLGSACEMVERLNYALGGSAVTEGIPGLDHL